MLSCFITNVTSYMNGCIQGFLNLAHEFYSENLLVSIELFSSLVTPVFFRPVNLLSGEGGQRKKRFH